MGTRGLTMVVHGRKTKVAQYGQWDHYPEGQGMTALRFCRKLMRAPKNRAHFLKQLRRIVWVREEDTKAELQRIGSHADKFHERFPFLSRDHGADVLNMIYEDHPENGPIELRDSSDFAGDSVFCEWAYVIDLDKNTFEVYKGFNETPLNKRERFFKTPIDPRCIENNNGYQPIKHVRTYKLSKLPLKDTFLWDCEPPEEDEESEDFAEEASE